MAVQYVLIIAGLLCFGFAIMVGQPLFRGPSYPGVPVGFTDLQLIVLEVAVVGGFALLGLGLVLNELVRQRRF